MYGGRILPAHSFDHTRRYQNDIVVYSDNELRRALGYVKRGTRVVIANDISVTKPIEVKVADTLIDTDDTSAQSVIISGFGTGKLKRKNGITDAFDLFKLQPGKDGAVKNIQFSDLSFDGFDHAVFVDKGSTAFNLVVKGCSIENCNFLVGGGACILQNCFIDKNYLFSNASQAVGLLAVSNINHTNITDNIMYSHDGFAATPTNAAFGFGVASFYSNISGNVISGTALFIGVHSTEISGNIFWGQVEIAANPAGGSANRIMGNLFTSFISPALEISGLGGMYISNKIQSYATSGAALRIMFLSNEVNNPNDPMTGLEGCMVRNNLGNTAIAGLREQDAPGRISIPGELLGQTIIDGVAIGTFSKTVSSTLFSQLDDDVDNTRKAFVTFYVPQNKKVVIRLHTSIYDDDSAQANLVIRITDQNSAAGIGFPLGVDVQQTAVYMRTAHPVYTFEWYVDGDTDDGGSPLWSVGQQVTLWFQVRVDNAAETIKIVAGSRNHGPMNITAVATHDDLVVVP